MIEWVVLKRNVSKPRVGINGIKNMFDVRNASFKFDDPKPSLSSLPNRFSLFHECSWSFEVVFALSP